MQRKIDVFGTKQLIRRYKNDFVVTGWDIARLYGFDYEDIQSRLYKAMSKLTINNDYYLVEGKKFKKFSDDPTYNYPRGGKLFTRSGFIKIAKMFERDNNEAEEITHKMLDDYFPIPVIEPEPKAQEDEAVANSDDNDDVVTQSQMAEVNAAILELKDMIQTISNNLKIQNDTFKQLQDVGSKLNDNYSSIASIIAEVKEIIQQKPVINTDFNELKESDVIIVNTQDYDEWRKPINKAINLIIEKSHVLKTKENVLHHLYLLATKKYGVCYKQEGKDFYNEHGRSCANNLELTFWMETSKSEYKNLAISILNTMYSYAKRGEDVERKEYELYN